MLSAIEIENFRCIKTARLDFDPRSTGIIGDNASGKTSLLEAIYFLSHGRSFRTNRREKLLRDDANYFRLVARLEVTRGSLVAGIEYANEQTRAHLAGQGVSGVADIAEVLPVQVIDPGVHRLIEEGSSRRRRLMDWGVFHVKHEFLPLWRRYQRALQQRNAALRHEDAAEMVSAWETELCASGAAVDQLRSTYAAELEPYFARIAARLLGTTARFAYRRGWPADFDLPSALRDARSRDLRLRTTTVGPHRADLQFIVDDEPARDRVSRGQQKMLAAAFVLAQLARRAAEQLPLACLMLDDPAAELDVDNLGKLLAVIAEIPSQLVITSVHERGLQGLPMARKFHVKQGEFASML